MRVNWPRCSSSRPLPPRPVTSYFVGADRLLGAAAGFDAHDVAVAHRGHEPEHAVLVRLQLDEDHAAAGPRQVVHLVGPAQHAARLPRGGDDHLLAGDLRHAHDFDALAHARIAAARARAGLDERLETEAQAVAVARHGDGMHRRRLVFGDHAALVGDRRDLAGHARVQAQCGHHPFAVAQLEELLDRLAVPGGCRHVDDAGRVGGAEVAEEHHRGARAARQHRQHRVALRAAAWRTGRALPSAASASRRARR